jgi:hypothetical protein
MHDGTNSSLDQMGSPECTTKDRGLESNPKDESQSVSGPDGPSTITFNIHESDRLPDHSVTRIVEEAECSAGRLVNLLAKHFSCFRDETRFDGRKVRLLKRAQIFVADLWAALNGEGYGTFQDIDHITMFADYRVPQSLHSLGVLTYSPPLDYQIRNSKPIAPGHPWEVQLR